MKRIFVAVVAMLVAVSVSAQKKNLAYVDASTLTIINKIHNGGGTFDRLDVERYPSLTKNAKRAFRQSTGLALVFSTDSRNILLLWI